MLPEEGGTPFLDALRGQGFREADRRIGIGDGVKELDARSRCAGEGGDLPHLACRRATGLADRDEDVPNARGHIDSPNDAFRSSLTLVGTSRAGIVENA